MLFGDSASFERSMSFGWESIGVEGYKGIFRTRSFEGMVECEEAGDVFCVRYERCPDFFYILALLPKPHFIL